MVYNRLNWSITMNELHNEKRTVLLLWDTIIHIHVHVCRETRYTCVHAILYMYVTVRVHNKAVLHVHVYCTCSNYSIHVHVYCILVYLI